MCTLHCAVFDGTIGVKYLCVPSYWRAGLQRMLSLTSTLSSTDLVCAVREMRMIVGGKDRGRLSTYIESR